MKKQSSIFFFFLLIQLNVIAQNDSNRVDSVFISFNNTVVMDTVFNSPYKDHMILYNAHDTLIQLNKKIMVSYRINGVKIDAGTYTGKSAKDFYIAEYEDNNGTKIRVKTTKPASGIHFGKILTYGIPAIGILYLLVVVFGKRKTKIIARTEKRKDGKTIVEQLARLQYFKYTSVDKVPVLKKELIDSINFDNTLCTIESDHETLIPVDFKLYFCDGEDLFEEDGLTEYLTFVKSAFDKRGLKLAWDKETEIAKFSEKSFTHSIILNNKNYTASYKNNDDKNWGWATYNFIKMLNEQLELQNSPERIYPISGGNEGQLIFLTNEQFNYLVSLKLHDEYSPMEVEKWRP